MVIKISGLLIDKFEHISKDKKTGAETMQLKAIVYQKESHQTVNITLNSATYAKIEPLKPLSIDCTITTFAGQNGLLVTYLKELDVAA